MLVTAVRSFAYWYDGKPGRVSEGDVIDMPRGADWVKVGFAVKGDAGERETATIDPVAEVAVAPKAKRRRRVPRPQRVPTESKDK